MPISPDKMSFSGDLLLEDNLFMNTQFYRRAVTSLMALIFVAICPIANATEYFSWLSVRYPDQAVKTFLQGPYDSMSRCDHLNQSTWDNVLTACGSCSAESKFCSPMDELREAYAKAIRKERAAFPYVVATPAGRIIISGVSTRTAVAECQRLEEVFRSNGYGDARCVLP